MLKIGTFSKLSRLSIRMLRRYDELGLLQPVHTDPFTGYRYYREEQLTTAGRIAALRDMGFGLSAIGALLEDGGREELDRRLAEQQRVLEALLAETRQRLRLLDTARAQLRKDESTMEYSVTLKNLPQRRAACVRMTLPSYEAEHQLWQVMARETAPLSLRLEEPCLCSVTYYDGEYLELEGKQKTSADGLFTLETVACLGACGLAPVVTVNDKVHSKMTPELAIELLEELKKEEAAL